jgi:hypothetical protein
MKHVMGSENMIQLTGAVGRLPRIYIQIALQALSLHSTEWDILISTAAFLYTLFFFMTSAMKYDSHFCG